MIGSTEKRTQEKNPSAGESAGKARTSSRQLGFVGVDFGQRLVKIAQVEQRRRQLRLVFAVELEISSSPGLPGEQDASLSALARWRRLCRQQSAQQSFACLATKSAYVLDTYEGMAQHPAEQLPQIWEQLERRHHLRPEEATCDYWPTLRVNKTAGSPARLQLVAVRNRLTVALVKQLQSMHGTLSVLDSPPMALARCARLDRDAAELETIAVLDLSYSTSMLSVVERGVPVLSRALRGVSLSDLYSTIGSAHDLPLADSEVLYTRYVGTDRPANDVSQQLHRFVESECRPYRQSLQAEIKKSLEYAKSRLGCRDISGVLVVGGGASERHLSWLREDLGMNCWRFSPRVQGVEELADAAPRFAGAMALSCIPFLRHEVGG